MAEPQQYITISDFRPGIYSDLYASANASTNTASTGLKSSVPVANGAAVVENTYDCRADKTGALVPFWKRSNGRTSTRLPAGNGANTRYPVGYDSAYLLDAQANPRGARDPDIFAPFAPNYSTLLYTFMFSPTNNGVFNKFLHGVECYGTSGMDTVFWAKTNNTSISSSWFLDLPVGGITETRANNGGPLTTLPAYIDYAITGFFPRLINTTAGTITATELGFITANMAWCGQTPDKYDIGGTPNSSSVKSGSLVKYLGGIWTVSEGVATADEAQDALPALAYNTLYAPPYATTLSIPHQGRLVMTSTDVFYASQSGGYLTRYGGDKLAFSSPWHPTMFNGTSSSRNAWPFKYMVSSEQPISEIGAMGSITSDQMIIVKFRGGGAVIQGDLERPTIRTLPFIESTQGLRINGVHTTVGFVYGSRNGVFAWQGGEATTKLSPQLEGFFWDHTQGREGTAPYAPYRGARGRFGWWKECVFVPNNYFLDTEGGGWWRLSGIANEPYNVYSTNDNGDLLAYPWRLTSTQNLMWHWFDQSKLESAYSWQSQPIIETRGRKLAFQELRVVASYNNAPSTSTTASTITVTLTGYNQDGTPVTPVSTILSLAPTVNPKLLLADIAPNFYAEYVQVRIQASAGNTSSPAPKIHSISLGVREAARTKFVN